ncbi:purine-nucleoside phosphorylase [Lentilactobacillus hilgardii]|uniref:purine-nucleoside phosphorylase n=1 Tax=Lentilactobacillus hilgardii TaxID=1588 RepID=UPI0021C3FA77|nr:purine-nucleoside phosphorylase [Lentilactobacillus hilgardii]MCP9333021.1 purine-nucleoside phosphorylase [Lentilactobacillus hilgardii]MCP9349630.1 purine-nucleoside phosphorylase [Lentilactobacillus hilgardii]MCP9352498.1 purine-nucleoside phosphorylase [Lentilactobacillus hilgardii]
MSTHIGAKAGEIASTVLMPGDPLRAKYIAETYLENPVCYSQVRNMLGYTGTYKGKKISVQGSGMGIPSLAIYTTELIKEYGVKTIYRVGSCGGMSPDVKIRDVILGEAGTTDSSIIANTFGAGMYYSPIADFGLLDSAYHTAQEMGINAKVGNIFAADRFYNDELDLQKLIDYGVLATEMETAGLYLLAAKHHIKALTILTVSDHLLTGEALSAKERETSFDEMAKLSLETAYRNIND